MPPSLASRFGSLIVLFVVSISGLKLINGIPTSILTSAFASVESELPFKFHVPVVAPTNWRYFSFLAPACIASEALGPFVICQLPSSFVIISLNSLPVFVTEFTPL